MKENILSITLIAIHQPLRPTSCRRRTLSGIVSKLSMLPIIGVNKMPEMITNNCVHQNSERRSALSFEKSYSWQRLMPLQILMTVLLLP